ncbi:hypothetical protein P4H42_05840 [Paenibacillus macerans]|uniref:hypothetical protein n=1 Tax=Paenibacillus macerans TaxID=44252 RepID=UPI002DB7CABF|nr:hypothetical protein [Paenibacillus macerans]MEC0329144.1 hypothetical protein [Paenibacillus macerans]MED4954778.1 hypothetical protein [Paenibacillus macerans]
MIALNINEAMFKENLIPTLNEIAISQKRRIDEKCIFLVLPVKENGKKVARFLNQYDWRLSDDYIDYYRKYLPLFG